MVDGLMLLNLFFQDLIYLYFWIGWVGRKYVRAVSNKNPAESEIIINVPLALK
jgi:hypothetical protein